LVCPHITSKTGYIAIASRLGFGNNLVYRYLQKLYGKPLLYAMFILYSEIILPLK
jgi:hypothetical protein